ncbi:MAG: hypothetical protein DDT20_00845 [Firmicutes bacterium]|nr:hypothetical protein [Bacillota bacterium]
MRRISVNGRRVHSEATHAATQLARNPFGKHCSDCWQAKALSEFNRDATRLDGLQPGCKSCVKARTVSRTAGGLPLWHTIRDALRAAAPK